MFNNTYKIKYLAISFLFSKQFYTSFVQGNDRFSGGMWGNNISHGDSSRPCILHLNLDRYSPLPLAIQHDKETLLLVTHTSTGPGNKGLSRPSWSKKGAQVLAVGDLSMYTRTKGHSWRLPKTRILKLLWILL